AFEHIGGELAAKQDFAHPQEERQRGERPTGCRAPNSERHAVTHRALREKLHRNQRDAQQGQADPQARTEQCEHGDDEKQGDEGFHGESLVMFSLFGASHLA
ncbi:MAG: hypothetical protein RLZZ86_3818, partial [Cyanobacteriota bacterium]